MKNDIRVTAAVRTETARIPAAMAIPVGIVLFALLTAVGAYIRIPLPFTPVPVTLQVFFVLLCAAIMGPYYGSASQFLYIALGAAGVPMFTTAGVGLAHLAGPTGGYIIGFVIAQPVIAFIVAGGSEHKTSTQYLQRLALAMTAGIFVIYTAGMTQLAVVTSMGFEKAFYAGVAPFLLTDIAKAAAACAAALAFHRRFGSIV